MDDIFKIFISRLADGRQESIDQILAPTFLDIHEAELAFKDPVHIGGTVELSEGELIIRLHVETIATMPCAICNLSIPVPLKISNLCHIETIDKGHKSYFDLRGMLREALLVELPYVAECNEGNCPDRAVLTNYLKTSN